jgi:hypothetical protein
MPSAEFADAVLQTFDEPVIAINDDNAFDALIANA